MQHVRGPRAAAWAVALSATLVLPLAAPAWAASGDVATFGGDAFGQLGNGAAGAGSSPTTVLAGASDVAGGREHTLALVAGTVWGWGADTKGAVGDGGAFSTAVPAPARVVGSTGGEGPTGVDSIATGHYHSMALDRDLDVVWAWGWNSRGQLGPAGGTRLKVGTAAVVAGLPGGQVTMIAAGRAHSLAVVDGRVYAWGDNGSGQLGSTADTARHPTPAPVAGLPAGVTWVAGGRDSSFAIAGGVLYAWGSNNYGQLGLGAAAPLVQPTPTRVVDGVLQVESGADHTIALLSDGSVSSWGRNRYGQLGYAGTANQRTPKATGLRGIAEVRVGRDHSMAISTTGTFSSWGRNDGGQLGPDVAGTSVPTPTVVPALAGVRDAGGGQVHTVVLR